MISGKFIQASVTEDKIENMLTDMGYAGSFQTLLTEDNAVQVTALDGYVETSDLRQVLLNMEGVEQDSRTGEFKTDNTISIVVADNRAEGSLV